MAEKKKRQLVYSYHVNMYTDGVEVKINNWDRTVPGKLQRTFDAILTEWHRLQRLNLQELRVKAEEAERASKDKKDPEPTLPEGAVPSRKEVENV